jgi:putative DNA primase/helicase
MIEDRNKKRAREEAAKKADAYCNKDGGPPDPVEVKETLGGLDYVEYGQRRVEIAEDLGISREFLDLEYRARRKAAREAPQSTTGFLDKEPEPWEEEVDGDSVLDELVLAVNKHLVTQDGAAEAVALWCAFVHALGCFRIAPILAVTSPTIECGKSTLLRLLRELTPRALPASNITSAALFRAIDKWHPTLLVDEADTFLKDNEELRGVLNSGHHRGDGVVRTIGDKHEPAYFDTFGAKAIALVGKLPPSLASRSIHIEMKRKRAAEKVDELRIDRLGHLLPIKRRLARWVNDHEQELRDADPAVPAEVHGRSADNWRPLFAVADIAGADWPEKARRIAVKLSASAEDDTWGILLLEDLGKLYAERNADRMASKDICSALAEVEERPWPEICRGNPITQSRLASLLKPFGIVPTTVRFENRPNAKGYNLERLQDAISRYVGSSPKPSPEGSQAVTPLQALRTKVLFENLAVTRGCVVTAENAKKPRKTNGCNVVTARNPQKEGNGGNIPAWARPTIGEEAPTTGGGDEDPFAEFPDLPWFLDRRNKP